MNPNPQEILFKILEIIEYKEDKSEFMKDFLFLCRKQAVINLLQSLPEDKQDLLKDELSKEQSPEETVTTLNEYFTNAEFEKAMNRSSEKMFRNFLEKVMPNLSKEKLKELKELFESYNKSQSS